MRRIDEPGKRVGGLAETHAHNRAANRITDGVWAHVWIQCRIRVRGRRLP